MRDILSEYGPERAGNPPAPPLPGNQGRVQRDVMGYQEPQGPINRHNPSPGLPGGTNVGTGPNMGGTGDGGGGSPGLHGDNLGNCGSQGCR